MTKKFFPGCKMKEVYPDASKWLSDVVIENGWADEIVGCCSVFHKELSAEDVAVCVCNKCLGICEEASEAKCENVWVLMDNAEDFPLPDLGGKTYALQDCARVYDHPEIQRAVRSLLGKMNVNIIELPDNREDCSYCGPCFLGGPDEQESAFAPNRYVEDANARGFYKGLSDEDKPAALAQYCESIPADDVLSYCLSCEIGMRIGGKHSVHLIELIAGTNR